MSKPDDGGPAFPDGEGYIGMSLRDWFAGLAMQGLLAVPELLASMPATEGIAESRLAGSAYEFADAMLAERAKGRP